MEFELLNELVENGYDGEDLDELFEFAIDYILEYEELLETEEDQKKHEKLNKLGATVGFGSIGAYGGIKSAKFIHGPSGKFKHVPKTAKIAGAVLGGTVGGAMGWEKARRINKQERKAIERYNRKEEDKKDNILKKIKDKIKKKEEK